jgi:predicted ester cyclase
MISIVPPTLAHRQAANKALIAQFRAALYDCDPAALPGGLAEVFAPDCQVHLADPLGDCVGPAALYERAYAPLIAAIPDLERRDFIVVGGPANDGADWVGCCGHYVGVFERPWLDIPATLSMVAMRFHEFFRIAGGRVVEMQAIWDIPQLMLQAQAWPLAPSLGVEWVAPAPTTQDGIVTSPYDPTPAAASVAHVGAMLTAMGKHPLQGGPEVMELERYWHPKMCWYGPAGIGQMRRASGFRNWHQIPFLRALPDRRVYPLAESAMFGDANYVAVTGWPDMQMTVTRGGWLGIAPGGQDITMRSLDFWRLENGLIRENWVLIDLLNVYDQLGLDVFQRMREVTHARQAGFRL